MLKAIRNRILNYFVIFAKNQFDRRLMKWQIKDNFLEKNFSFETFADAMCFVNRVAEIAERLNHHPEIFMHNYNQVRVQTTTHSAGKITQMDHDLIKQIDTI